MGPAQHERVELDEQRSLVIAMEFFRDINDVNKLLSECDREQRAFELAHPTPQPQPQPQPKASTPQPEPGLSRAEVAQMIRAATDLIVDAISAETGEIEKQIRKELREEFENRIGELRGEIGELRGEVNVSSGVINFDKWRNDNAA
jgi:hypothetical protein